MPHLIVEYSANLESKVDIASLVQVVHEAALETGIFPNGGIRTRAARRDVYRIADGHDDNAFVHVSARIGEGRPAEVRARAGEHVFNAVRAALSEVFANTPLGISFEMSQIDATASFKQNNLHDILKDRESP